MLPSRLFGTGDESTFLQCNVLFPLINLGPEYPSHYNCHIAMAIKCMRIMYLMVSHCVSKHLAKGFEVSRE